MLTECARCGKSIDTVQGYKFGPNQYLCMPCYDQFKADRAAKAKKEHVNPLVQKFGKEPAKPAAGAPAPQQPQKAQPSPQAFQPRPSPKPAPPPAQETAARPVPPSGPEKAASVPPQKSAAEICDICKKPLSGFKFPLKGGKKVCLDCNNLLRDVAKSLILNVQCPHCGKEIQLSQD